jgi:hypothetical protein
MANHCYNFVTLWGDVNEVKKLNNRLTKLRDDALKEEYTDKGQEIPKYQTAFWVHSGSAHKILFQKPDELTNHFDVYEKYGSKWFECNWEYNEEDDFIVLQGDSAWSPMLPLFQKICRKYKLRGEGNYEESGMDLAGEFEITIDGEIMDIQMTYREFMQKNNPESYWDQLLCDIDDGVFDSLDDIINEFNADIWKLTEEEKTELEDAFRKYEQRRLLQTN